MKIVCLQDTVKRRVLICLVLSVFKAVYGLGEVQIINLVGVKPIINLIVGYISFNHFLEKRYWSNWYRSLKVKFIAEFSDLLVFIKSLCNTERFL